MKFTILILSVFYFQISFGQKTDNNITSKIIQSGDNSHYFEKDNNENVIYSLNNGMNGPITMVSASDYDSSNRKTKYYSAHSNIGYYLSENVYSINCIKSYKYYSNSDKKFPYNRKTLNEIKSREDFIKMKVFLDLEKGKKSLSTIEYRDSSNNVLKQIFLSKEGDTTSINISKYNSNNQEVYYHHGTIGSEAWTWDIYNLYDDNNNQTKSYRISSSDGVKDTTEVRNYKYNKSNLKTSENYYYKGEFKNRSTFFYNRKNLLKTVLFYGKGKNILDVKTIYKYNSKGKVKRKIVFDYRNPKKDQKKITKLLD